MQVQRVGRAAVVAVIFAGSWCLGVPASYALTSVSAEPELDRRLLDPRITESSGLAASNRFANVVWTHNDSGDDARIFAIGADGKTRAVFRLGDLVPRDWEAISASTDGDGRRWLWVGDIGDNSETRDRGILVHRVPEPETLRSGTLAPTSYRLRYPDEPHDAEALLVHPRTGRLYIVTKRIFGGDVYRAPAKLNPDGPNRLEKLGSAPSLVTDGVFLPDGRAALRDYGDVTVLASLDDPKAERERVSVTMPPVGGAAAQAESIALGPDGSLLLGSEGPRSPVVRLAVPEEPPPAGGEVNRATPKAAGESPSDGDTADEEGSPARRGSAILGGATLLAVAGAFVLWARRG